MESCKVIIYDTMPNGRYSWLDNILKTSWWFGAKVLYSDKEWISIGVDSVDAMLNKLIDIASKKKISELQLWGHGGPGRFCVGNTALDLHYTENSILYTQFVSLSPFTNESLFWFRSCSTASEDKGRIFMKKYLMI
jgi:hypothetical protein